MGSEPIPADTVVSPIWLSGGQAPSLACVSGHSFTPVSSPDSPLGMCSWMDWMFWFPSWRLIVVVNGLNCAALMFVVPAVRVGANGSADPGHGLAFGPEVISKVEVDVTGGLPDHGVNVALVV